MNKIPQFGLHLFRWFNILRKLSNVCCVNTRSVSQIMLGLPATEISPLHSFMRKSITASEESVSFRGDMADQRSMIVVKQFLMSQFCRTQCELNFHNLYISHASKWTTRIRFSIFQINNTAVKTLIDFIHKLYNRLILSLNGWKIYCLNSANSFKHSPDTKYTTTNINRNR